MWGSPSCKDTLAHPRMGGQEDLHLEPGAAILPQLVSPSVAGTLGLLPLEMVSVQEAASGGHHPMAEHAAME